MQKLIDRHTQYAQAIKSACLLDFPYEESFLLNSGKKAAVLLLFGFRESTQALEILFLKRTETVLTHKGQMAFPGGGWDDQDLDLSGTAQRETLEETGIKASQYKILGQLPVLWTVSDYLVTPMVALSPFPIESIPLIPDPSEVAEICWIPLSRFSEKNVYRQEQREYFGKKYPVQVYQVDEIRIWGATGSMVKNLLDRLSSLRLMEIS